MVEFNRKLFSENSAVSWTISKTILRNQLVDTPGETNTNMYLVKSGAIKVCCYSEEREIILAFGVKDDLVTNLVSFLRTNPRRSICRRSKRLRLIGMTKTRFMELVDTDPVFAERYCRALENKILETIQRQLNHFNKNPKERVERLLALKPDVFQQIPRKYIAYYLGLAPETISRLIKS